MSDNYWAELSSDYEAILENDYQHDVVIEVGKHPNKTKFQAHSLILRVRCSYFKKELEKICFEKTDDGRYIFTMPNISATVFKVILRYLYTGVIDYKNSDRDMLISCLVAADELHLVNFLKHVEDYLCAHPDLFKTEVVATLEAIHKIESAKRLTDCCLEMISASPEILLSSKRFSELDQTLMKMILQREDLKMSVAGMWDVLIRWVTVHCLIGQPDCVRSWEERRSEAKAAIEALIPLIGIYDMSRVDFNSRVLPYVELLPPDLVTSVLGHHVHPLAELPEGYKRAKCTWPTSVLMQPGIRKLFAEWIKSTNISVHLLSLKYNLLFRASRDGFEAAAFHRRCDNKGATMVLSKIKNSQLLIGGYNPLCWSSSEKALSTPDSFIFTLNPNDLESAKLSRILKHRVSDAIYDYCNRGPTFGSSLDLLKGSDSYSAAAGSEYHPPINLWPNFSGFTFVFPNSESVFGQNTKQKQEKQKFSFGQPQSFEIQECEVFQILSTHLATSLFSSTDRTILRPKHSNSPTSGRGVADEVDFSPYLSSQTSVSAPLGKNDPKSDK